MRRDRMLSTCLALLGALIGGHLNLNVVNADVGVPSSTSVETEQESTMGPNSWTLTSEGCRVGKAGNLVVTPLKGSTREGAEILDTSQVGPQLCTWLSLIQKAHNDMEHVWTKEHARKRAEVSRWNIISRIRMWSRTFPRPEFLVRVRHIDLWNNDRFGHAMPWITAEFHYKCPDAKVSYGMTDHLCGTFFADRDDRHAPARVHLLLRPRYGYNSPLKVEADPVHYLTGMVSGLLGRRKTEDKELEASFAWVNSAYAEWQSFMSVEGKVDDFWLNNGQCYFRGLLHLEWKIIGETVCERLHRDANENAFSALKASAFNTVRLDITETDFFNYRYPVLWGHVGEGILISKVSSGALRIEVDTNPQNAADFKRSKSTMQTSRAAGLLLTDIAKLVSSRKED